MCDVEIFCIFHLNRFLNYGQNQLKGQGWGDEGVDCLVLKLLRIVLECFVRREAGCEVRLWTELRSFGFSQKVGTVKKVKAGAFS